MIKTALILGATGGIGAAISAALRDRGWDVTARARRDGLEYLEPASVERVLSALTGPFDLIFIATGALVIDGRGPEKALGQIEAEGLAAQFAINTIGPALVLRHAARLLPRDRRSMVAALSARVGSIGDNKLGGWYGYRAAKAALNQILHGAAIELTRSHPESICVALHPGTVDTPLTAQHGRNHDRVSPGRAAQNLLTLMDTLTVSETGTFFDWAGKKVDW